MKRIVTLLLLTVSINAISGQYIQPKVWRMAGDSSAVVRTDTIAFTGDYTIIGVGRMDNAEDTLAYWRLNATDSTFAEMTNHGIGTESVTPHNQFNVDVIHNHIVLLSQSYKKESYDSLVSLQSGMWTEMKEYAYFDKRLEAEDALRFQTYLAVKYGITLDMSDYLAGDSVIWNAENDEEFYNRVIGIGCDSIYGLRSKVSVQCADEPTIRLSADTLFQGQYVMAGDNDQSLALSRFDTIPNVLMRHWRIRNHGIDSVMVVVDPSSLGCISDGFRLIRINHDGYSIVEPLSADSSVCFKIKGLEGDDEITFIGMNPRSNIRGSDDSDYSEAIDGEMSLSVYPNPTTGVFNVDVSLPEVVDAELTVTTASGQTVISETLSGSQIHNRTYEIGVPQIYYVEVKSGDAGKIVKLIVY